MFSSVISFSLKNKLIIILLVVALIIAGIYSFRGLPIDAVPDITNNQVQVITLAPDLATTEIEQFITFPVEQALATIPGRTELRSMSKFGLSLVTIVFTDETNIYLARQQIAEKLAEIQEQIPAGAGKPVLAPVTTGLGEIYQYTLRIKPGYENKYTLTDLRTIQDWIVKRQLQGTAGVADISSFGGNLKQYEVAINPDRLKASGVSLKQIFDALESNNQNTGGAYIEKGDNIWYIRSEGLAKGKEDIGLTEVTRTPSGAPLLIRDLAEVRIGKAIRYGAMTNDTLGETAGGIVLMIKGGNSSQVIESVKKRIEEIKPALPDGITILPYLDRTKLVNNAISTVEKNLTEGALIVIFVLVILLGNLRAGLIVASVIPLAMLFAICMMRLFGVSGNLMSLGAIDFGLIVDGAVIIVEAVIHKLQLGAVNSNSIKRISRQELDNTVKSTSEKMMHFSAFGQLIILIVYLPILSLAGIEGKMFRPMAETVAFAIAGALILSMTWVPVASTLFLNKNLSAGPDFSERFMASVRKKYLPILRQVLIHPVRYIFLSIALLACSIFVFNTLGGEFLPALDEGDFAIEMRLPTGSSITRTTEVTERAAKILMERFPEVISVTGKIGTSEIPIDPMPPESCDLIVTLKEKKEWESASSKEELAEKMAAALQNIPGASFGFQQPIQMRFNELMTGARQDVVVKIFGENLDTLAKIAARTARLTSTIEGASDIYEEKLSGLPQLVVKLKRERLARYGISVNEVNRALNMAYAGQQSGLVFEGEKRFALVVRMMEEQRSKTVNLEQLTIPDKQGNPIPLTDLAEIKTEIGPVQIQRDDARRRAVVGFNVRGVDIETVVNQLKSKLSEGIKLPPGYGFEYSGQFKNLSEARDRLAIAVPTALLLIFVLLYFTFRSVKFALLIFTSVPFSAIGGILALWLRDMPFSISAGIGFIALSGISVLNGIVLIGVFNQLKKAGETDVYSLIIQGASERIRPILMTATVASLGFLPMALSNSPGAEVQKPLATVVIGGLISATILTLLILPAFYLLFDRFNMKTKLKTLPILIISAILLPYNHTYAQTLMDDKLEDIIRLALDFDPRLKGAHYETDAMESLEPASFDPAPISLGLLGGQYNSNYKDQNYSLSQLFPFPSTVIQQAKVNKSQTKSARISTEKVKKELVLKVSETWYTLAYLMEMREQILYQDSIFSLTGQIAETRFNAGESAKTEKLSLLTEKARLKTLIMRTDLDINSATTTLQMLTGLQKPFRIGKDVLSAKHPIPEIPEGKPWEQTADYRQAEMEHIITRQNAQLEKSKFFPSIALGYFSQSLTGIQNLNGQDVFFGRSHRFTGYQAGLSFPLFFSAQRARCKSANYLEKAAAEKTHAISLEMADQLQKAKNEILKSRQMIEFYESTAIPSANAALNAANVSWKNGEISYMELAHIAKQNLTIKEDWAGELLRQQLSILKLEYLLK